MEDREIVELYWARDQRALRESSDKYGAFCYRMAQDILARREDSEECVNDTWHRAWTTMPPQRPNSLRAYLGRIVRNLSLDRWRRRQAQKRGAGLEVMLGELEDCVPAAAPAADPQKAVEERELAALLDNWLWSLERTDRIAFLRRYWYGVRVDELAREAGCTPNQMAQRLMRLRGALRRVLEWEGVVL